MKTKLVACEAFWVPENSSRTQRRQFETHEAAKAFAAALDCKVEIRVGVDAVCCERVQDKYHVVGRSCRTAPTVFRNGRPYCSVHDPERIAQREQARRAEVMRENNVREKIRATAQDRADRLAGSVEYHSRGGRGWGPTGNIVITGARADILFALRCAARLLAKQYQNEPLSHTILDLDSTFEPKKEESDGKV